jgi:hypothetical protein
VRDVNGVDRDGKKVADLKKRLEELDHSELVMAEMNKKAGRPDLSKLNQKNKSINIVSEGLVSDRHHGPRR